MTSCTSGVQPTTSSSKTRELMTRSFFWNDIADASENKDHEGLLNVQCSSSPAKPVRKPRLSAPRMLLFLQLFLAASSIAKRAPANHGFDKRSLAPRDAEIKLHIALKQHDGGAAIEKRLLHTSDPDSPEFRQHLSAKEVAELSRPSQEYLEVVNRWLEENGLKGYGDGILEVDAKVYEVERLLNATYHSWTDGSQTVMRTEEYHIPEDVARHIDFITPTTMFPRPKKETAFRTVQLSNAQEEPLLSKRVSCGSNDDTTPTCIRQLYNITYTPQPNRTTFAVYATEAASFSNSDLQTYLKTYNPSAAGATYQIIGSGDPANGQHGIEQQFETALDTQVLLGLAWPAKGVLYNLGGVFGPKFGVEYDPFVKFLTDLATNETVPSVVSFSESQPEDRIDRDYALRLCNLMAQVGLRGVTLLFSSGNNGANGDSPSGEHKTIFEPEFPASCLWVTSVGGTTNLADEQGATKANIPFLSSFGYTSSGGGFSNTFPAPAWQYTQVANYISDPQNVPAKYKAPGTGFPQNGAVMRGIPDVSAISTSWPTVVNGLTVPIGGTSSAAPTWAAIITLLNDYQSSKGRGNLGFINPWLYSLQAGQGLKDITRKGNNVGDCNLVEGCTLTAPFSGKVLYGYNVTVGWDPVTGLGSPSLGLLMESLDRRGY